MRCYFLKTGIKKDLPHRRIRNATRRRTFPGGARIQLVFGTRIPGCGTETVEKALKTLYNIFALFWRLNFSQGVDTMSGHSKWANIKRKKGAADAARAKVFTRIGKEIQIAVRDGGPNPDNNSKLKDVIAKAKANNMPNDNIQRSIKKAAGEGGGESIEEIRYEGYGPGGVAIMVDVVTDNRNRTASEVRHVFDEYGGNLGNTGCVSFMFDKKGVIVIENDGEIDEETLMMDVLEAGAEDFNPSEEVFEITTAPADFSAVSEALEAKGYVFEQAEVRMVPQTYVHLTDEKQLEQINKILEGLDDNDDVIDVFHSWDEEEE